MGYAEHGAPDYASKTAAGCEATGEPCFLLRGRDSHAPGMVALWADEVSDPHLVADARRISEAMIAWQRQHGAKEPDWDRPDMSFLPVGPCPACGSSEIDLVTVDGYGRVWLCECDRQVPERTLPPEILREVLRQRDDG